MTDTHTEHTDDRGRACDMDEARYDLVENANRVLESLGEKFIEERFITTCPLPGFESARLERFTRTKFPRILLEFDCFDRAKLSTSGLKADLKGLSQIVERHPDQLQALLDNLDDPDRFRELSSELGFSEEKFLAEGGGLIGWIIVIAAAAVLTGCGNRRCGVKHDLDDSPCREDAGHSGHHRDNQGHRWR